MEEPTTLSSSPSPPKRGKSNTPTTKINNGGDKRRPPTPEELLALYESQGLESKEASLKAIGDLQTVLYRTLVSARAKDDAGRKLDNLNTRLAILEMKVDAKPGFPESLAIGVAAGAALKGIGIALPHVLGAFGHMWGAVKTVTGGGPRHPSS